MNDNDTDDDQTHPPPAATSQPKNPETELLIPDTNEPESPQKLYPTAPQLDESDESTASVHSTEV